MGQAVRKDERGGERVEFEVPERVVLERESKGELRFCTRNGEARLRRVADRKLRFKDEDQRLDTYHNARVS